MDATNYSTKWRENASPPSDAVLRTQQTLRDCYLEGHMLFTGERGSLESYARRIDSMRKDTAKFRLSGKSKGIQRLLRHFK